MHLFCIKPLLCHLRCKFHGGGLGGGWGQIQDFHPGDRDLCETETKPPILAYNLGNVCNVQQIPNATNLNPIPDLNLTKSVLCLKMTKL